MFYYSYVVPSAFLASLLKFFRGKRLHSMELPTIVVSAQIILEDTSPKPRHTIRPVLAGTVLVLRALSRRPGQSTKISRLGIQSAMIVPHRDATVYRTTVYRTTIHRTTIHRTTVYRTDSSSNRQFIEPTVYWTDSSSNDNLSNDSLSNRQFIEPTVYRTDSLSNRQFIESTVYRKQFIETRQINKHKVCENS